MSDIRTSTIHTAVDVARTHWALPFPGDSALAEGTTMAFPDFLACLLQAPEEGKEGDDDDDDEMAFYASSTSPWARHNLYLAQSSIFERARKQADAATPSPLAALDEHIDR